MYLNIIILSNLTMDTNLANKYQKKTDKQHILDNPDTYIGSVEKVEHDEYVYSEENKSIKKKNIEYIPGLYKLFDEAIVNCRDHVVRMLQNADNINVSSISISVSDDGTMTFMNDGNGIDVALHPEYHVWIPEMIFAHLRTGTNYDKSEKKIVGGKNGFGSKLIFIWSCYGELETVDHVRGLKFTQTYSNNLDVISEPVITKCKNKPYTKIMFKPDYERLGLTTLTDDIKMLLKRRVYDIAAITPKNVKVKYNGEILSVKSFSQYIDLYIGNKDENARVYEESNERWEYAVCLSTSEDFQQVSFVNGIFTPKGGKHVEYIVGQLIKKLIVLIYNKKKVEVKPATLKEQLQIFIRCDIENPSFDSQTKDYMNTPFSKFGSSCVVSDKFVEKVAKLGVMNTACAMTSVKENKDAKKSDGAKSKSIRGIPKLVDANYAGTSKSEQCIIIFCEGDSAKAGIISGLSNDDRNFIGVYPMKGKLFNVRGETLKRINENKEIVEIKQILGLETERTYTLLDVKARLRYGKILFMTDQDLDGSHIKGLGVNLFNNQWGSITKLGIIGFMNTPILKARKGSKEVIFYYESEYESWLKSHADEGWKTKYYKGLGTSTSAEFKQYFKDKKMVYFTHTKDSDDSIDKVFNKSRSDDRKEWLSNYNPDDVLNTACKDVSYENFIDKEMKHFSKYDCDRSIPNVMDGLKTSQRKILYASFKKKLNSEIKVAQFSGYVSEHSCYHHGEASLNGAIVNMAQDYVGSNNINLLLPNGQFGTRLNGGKDSASERYIFTQLNPLTRLIFPEADDDVLDYLTDDGQSIEPRYYAPIIPMILVNGCKGIGTGFSTDIMQYNPIDIIDLITNILKKKPVKDILPNYRGFKGDIDLISLGKFKLTGKWNVINSTKFRITELPVATWTDDYKRFLESLIDLSKPIVKEYVDMSTDTTVDITITTTSPIDTIDMDKIFKLSSRHSSTNMHAFTSDEQLKHFADVNEIITCYMVERRTLYEKRKQFMIKKLEGLAIVIENKVRYINELLVGTIDLRNMKRVDIIKMLTDKTYLLIDNYNYLTHMPMDSVSSDKVTALINENTILQNNLNSIKAKTPDDMWLSELAILRNSI
jgi:DNA topoisomerase-2